MFDNIDTGRFDETYFENLISDVEDHPDWQLDEDSYCSREEIASRAADKVDELSMVEAQFEHPAGGVLRVQLPEDESEVALKGRTRNTVMGEPKQEIGDFPELLEDSYQTIAEDHNEGEYTETSSSSHLSFDLNTVAVPWDYNEEELYTSLDCLSDAVQEAGEMNQELRETVVSYQQE